MKFAFAIFISLLIACVDRTNSNKNENQDYYPTYTKHLEDTTQTLDLEYIAWACECANWATPNDINIKTPGNSLTIVFLLNRQTPHWNCLTH